MMEETGSSPACGGPLCPVRRLQLPQPTSPPKVLLVLRLVRAARLQPAAVMPLLVVALRQEQASDWQKVAAYRSLRAMLERGLRVEPVHDFIVVASEQLIAPPAQQAPRELQLAASNALASLARCHFNPVMTALQRQLKPFARPEEFTLLTLGQMAANNVYGCVPFLGITLTTLQTGLRWIKDSRRRRALCAVLEQMCGVIQTYLQSWEQSSYPRINSQQFSAYLFPLYTCIARTWLPESSFQVRLAVLRALSPMLNILLPRTEVQAQIHADIPLFLGQCQRASEAFLVTKILGQILEASLVTHTPVPGRLVAPIAGALACQVCAKGRRWPPSCRRRENHTAISLIFLALARLHPAGLMEFFQQELTDCPEESRVGLLRLLSGIISAHLPELWSRRHRCLRAVKTVLGEASAKVRLGALQAIGALLQAGYLERVEGWPLNYISWQLAVAAHRLSHPVLRLPLGGLEETAAEIASMEVLQSAVALGRGASQELWTKVLSYLMQPHYTACAAPLCRALSLLAAQRLDQKQQGSLEAVDSPTAQELLARLLGLTVSPFEGAGRGAAALRLLEALCPEVYRDMAEHWRVELPALVQHLEGHSQYTLEPAAWEHRLLEFLKKSLWRNREGGWNLALGQELSQQVGVYPGSSREKAFLCKAWGIALSAARNATTGVMLQLGDLLLHTDYADQAQREGACWCLTHCAEGQLLAALKALRSFEQEVSEGEGLAHCEVSQGLPQPAQGTVPSALLLLYSSVAVCAPWEQLLPQLAGTIVPRILHHYDTLRSPEVLPPQTPPLAAWSGPQFLEWWGKFGLSRAEEGTDPEASGPHISQGAKHTELALSFARCVSEVSLSIQGRGGAGAAFQLPQKRELVDRLVDIVRAEPLDALRSPVRQQAMAALRHLSKVPAVLSCEERREVAETCLSCTVALPPLELPEEAGQALYAATLAALAGLVETLVEEEDRESASPTWLQEVFQLLGPWLASEQEWERARAVQLAVHLLQARCQQSSPPPRLLCGQLGCLAGVLGPLTCEALGTVRQGASDCIGALLSIQGCDHPWRLHRARLGLLSQSTREVQRASFQLAKVVSRALPSQEVPALLCTLLEQLSTVRGGSSDRAALLWFEAAVRAQGLRLREKVPPLVAAACSALQQLPGAPAQRLLLARAVCLLAQQHHRAVCASLLDQPLLQDRTWRDLWGTLVTPPEALGAPTLKLLLAWVREEEEGKRPRRLSVLAALQEVVLGLGSCAQLLPLLSDLCHTLLAQLGQDRGAEELRPASIPEGDPGTGLRAPGRAAVAVLQAVFSQVLPEAEEELDAGGAWSFLAQPSSCLKGVALLARALVHSDSPLLDGLLHRLLPALNSPGAAACSDLSLVFCVELTGHPLLHTPEMQDLLLRQLLAKSHVQNATMRALAMRGLGSVAEAAPPEVKKRHGVLLAALLEAAGDAANPEVACESLRALSKVWGRLGRRRAGRVLRAVAGQARAHLWHADDALRAAAFELFGQLAAEATGRKQGKAWTKEARAVSAPLLLHFRDPSPAVAKACQAAFRACAPFLGLQDLLVGDADAAALCTEAGGGGGHRHSSLLAQVCRHLAHTDPALLEALIAEMPRYAHCTWDGIRLAACELSGALLGTAAGARQQRGLLGWPDLDSALLHSLRSLRGDPCAAVEAAASEALQIVQQSPEGETRGCLATRDGRQGGRRRRLLRSGWFFGWQLVPGRPRRPA